MPISQSGLPHESVWRTALLPHGPPLESDASCDVCVVGGGMAGLLIAEALSRRNADVMVLERARLADGETSRTTAQFASALDDRLIQLERLHGERGARLAAESHAAAIDHVEALVRMLDIDCGWRRLDGYLAVNVRHIEQRDRLLEDELIACARAGVFAVRVDALPDPWPEVLGPAIRFPNQAQLHPLKFLSALAARLMASGVRICERTPVTQLLPGGQVKTASGHVVTCSDVVIATNTPLNNRFAVHTKQSGYQTYVIAVQVPTGHFPGLLFWDGLWEDDTAYHYVRLMNRDDDTDLLIVGGEDHKTGQGQDGDGPFRRLEAWTRAHFPVCRDVERIWSGEVMEPADALAYIGHNPGDEPNVYIVTGDSGNGMTHAGIAAQLIPDLIEGLDHPWKTLYDPARKPGWSALSEYISENANTLAQYRDWLRRGDVPDESLIPNGQGAILTRGVHRLAIYKDDQGRCTRLSATCPHLGGVVRWNDSEKTWDCPCHASRFDKYGAPIHGPANSRLNPAD